MVEKSSVSDLTPIARTIEETKDEQFKALQHLYSKLKAPEVFMKLSVLNALCSFQLSAKAEAWWWEFARYFAERPPGPEKLLESYVVFLRTSKTNRRLLTIKIKRIKKVWPLLQRTKLLELYPRYIKLYNQLKSILSPKSYSKTVVFAVKVFGYAGRIATGIFVPYPMELPLPLDSRILKLSKQLFGERSKKEYLKLWEKVAAELKLPPLHLDSLLWIDGNQREKLLKLIRSKKFEGPVA